MKKIIFIVFLAVVLLSWGAVGHHAIGTIAERHLTPAAQAAVRELLGTESLADIASWADDVRPTPAYRATEPWHYINEPSGLSFSEFERDVEGGDRMNVYKALLAQEKVATDTKTTKQQKTEALKFIVHFVGDMHQPMHVSHAEDKGGNTIQVNFEGKGTNLHSLWDSKLIDRFASNYQELASKVDHATPVQISQWQKDAPIKWAWESYEISSRLYAEVDAMKSRTIDDAYYQAHIGIVEQRLEQAGIRLAGVLNTLFAHGLVASVAGGEPVAAAASSGATSSGAAVKIDVKDAAAHVDENVVITAKVYGYKALDGMTLVNLGGAYPNQLMTVVLRNEATGLAAEIDGAVIRVTGKIEMYKGKPEIIVRDPKMIVKE
ncbi:MAG TPA: S1/P1 nuclease [Puia sp.]